MKGQNIFFKKKKTISNLSLDVPIRSIELEQNKILIGINNCYVETYKKNLEKLVFNET